MSKFSDNPDRKRFIKVEGFDNWQCMDYKTFYMNVRRQDQHIDECHKRDKNKYILYISCGTEKINFNTPELAFKAGYKIADELYQRRLSCKPKIYRPVVES